MLSLLTQQFLLLGPLVALVVLMTGLLLYVLYTTDGRFKLKLLLGPLLLAVAVFSFSIVGSKLGYAYPHALPAKFEYLAHKTIHDDHEKTFIDVLLIAKGERHARLHRVPYEKPLEKALEDAKKMQQSGGGSVGMSRGEKGEKAEGGSDDSSLPPFKSYKFAPQDVTPKEPLGPPPEAPAAPLKNMV